MAQTFEVTWSEGTVTPQLITSLLYQYIAQGRLYGTITVKEVSQEPITCVSCDKPIENKEVYCFECYAE